MSIKYEDVKMEKYGISLVKLTGKPIADIRGYVSMEFDSPVFKVSEVIFADGSSVFVEGEHDFPYIPADDKQPNMDEETLLRVRDPDDIEEDEE